MEPAPEALPLSAPVMLDVASMPAISTASMPALSPMVGLTMPAMDMSTMPAMVGLPVNGLTMPAMSGPTPILQEPLLGSVDGSIAPGTLNQEALPTSPEDANGESAAKRPRTIPPPTGKDWATAKAVPPMMAGFMETLKARIAMAKAGGMPAQMPQLPGNDWGKQECKFFNSPSGCFNGTNCRFLHGGVPAAPPEGSDGTPNANWLGGDWECPSCKDHQFARNTVCRKCGEPRPESAGPKAPPAKAPVWGPFAGQLGAPMPWRPVMPQVPLDEKGMLVHTIKNFKRRGEEFKQAWYNFCKHLQTPNYDPMRHEIPNLSRFLNEMEELEKTVKNGDYSIFGTCYGGVGVLSDEINQIHRKELQDALRPGGSMPAEAQAGDWLCPRCNDLQFARNLTCRMCGAAKPDGDTPVEYTGGKGPGRDEKPQLVLTDPVLIEFATKWKLHAESQRLLASISPEAQARVMAEFAPRDTTRDVNSVFMKFADGKEKFIAREGTGGRALTPSLPPAAAPAANVAAIQQLVAAAQAQQMQQYVLLAQQMQQAQLQQAAALQQGAAAGQNPQQLAQQLQQQQLTAAQQNPLAAQLYHAQLQQMQQAQMQQAMVAQLQQAQLQQAGQLQFQTAQAIPGLAGYPTALAPAPGAEGQLAITAPPADPSMLQAPLATLPNVALQPMGLDPAALQPLPQGLDPATLQPPPQPAPIGLDPATLQAPTALDPAAQTAATAQLQTALAALPPAA